MKQELKSILKKYKFKIILILFVIVVHEYLYIIPSKILGTIIDLIYNININKQEIINQTILLFGITIMLTFSGISGRILQSQITRGIQKHLADSVFKTFLKTKLIDIQNIKNGELMSYLTKDIGEIARFSYRLLGRFTKVILVLIFAIYRMRKVDSKLTGIILIPMLITLVLIIFLKRLVEINYTKSRICFTELSEYVQESTNAIRTTKAYSEEENQIQKFDEKNEKLKKSDILVDTYSAFISIAVSICLGVSFGIILLYGSKLVIHNSITIGELVAFTGYLTFLFEPVFWLPGVLTSFEKARISYKRLDKVFKLEKETLDFEKINFESISGDIEFRNLNFRYPGTTKNVLKNINLKIKKGTTLGIIGTIGSGKSTIVNLIEKLYEVEDNSIFIGEKDINQIDYSDLRNSICYITQENFLFSTSIKENIKLFKDIYGNNDILDSVDKAAFKEDLSLMNDGIDTIIGERGVDLSGGQKQRVIISRSFLEKANIVIFDDSFSALDNKTEEKVLKNIKELTKDKTCIIISNRISDVKDADNIIVLDEGNIIETGTHEELLKNSKLYTKFYKQQASILYEEVAENE